ncbi:MAG: metal ABC transporter permease [Lutimaribacter sp.]
MFDDFLLRALLAGFGVALAAAPIGCFVVWRRMAYFGDATAHAAILGVALSLAFGLPVFTGAVAVALLMALTVSSLSGRGYSMDTLLGVLAHSSLAFGLVAVSFLQDVRIDLMAYLFGDILAVTTGDLGVIWGGALGVARDWMASVSLDPVTKIGQAGGYVGDGVGTSNLAGRTMADLLLGRSTDLTSLCWVNHHSPKWEIEPLRFIAARSALLGADLADQIEGVTGRRSIISKVIARLTGKA